MSETPGQYASRLAAYVEGQDPIAMQREAPTIIAALLRGVSREKLKEQPATGKWSVTEIIMHLADDELTSSWRYRQMLEYENPTLVGFDQELWARVGDYASWEAEDALTLFRLLREANLKMFARLTPEQWERHGVHSERRPMTVRSLSRHMAAHDVNHIEQIRRILKAL